MSINISDQPRGWQIAHMSIFVYIRAGSTDYFQY